MKSPTPLRPDAGLAFFFPRPALPHRVNSLVVVDQLALSQGELETMRALALGYGEKGAAVVLDMPFSTVHKRVQNARQKLGARSSAQACGMLVKAELL
jgi:DNA-binding NarL/FixJ family response regulator